jgi:hypothetical protein
MLSDAEILFELAREQGCVSLHVRTAALEMFVAFQPGARNPMTTAMTSAPPAETGIWTAPHLATLLEIAEIGPPLAAGDTFARLDLLGEEIALKADRAAVVARHLVAPGTLLEFDAPIAAWREARAE